MLAQIMPGTEEFLNEHLVSAYLGTDPTADSLHIGHLCGVMMLRHLQRCGHKPIALVGGATGMIGDPSGKSLERNLLDETTLRHNQECIKKQLAKFLDFESDAPNRAELVNNYDWMKDFTFLDFAREVGKHITVNYMMAKESVQQRLNGTARDGLSFTEFTYQLLQGYDFLKLYQDKGVRLQLGGNDQWGNMTTGTELIRRTLGNDVEPAFALTCPLITKSDGKKFGKTESGNIWLDPKRTTPYKFYQFWLNTSDDDAERYIKIFTSLDRETIEACGVVSGNIFGVLASRAAFEQGEAWLDGLLDYLDGNRKELEDQVAALLPGAVLTPVEATYLAWLDLRGWGFRCEELAERTAKAGVVFTGGTFFGDNGEGFLRVNFACPRRNIGEAILRLKNALEA